MKVFAHHVYEYRKGLRNLVLHTTRAEHRARIEDRLTRHGIDYVIYPINEERINLFFGAPECVAVIRRIGKPRLADYTPEEDFMLGIMLGYDRLAQCRRYLIQHQRHARPMLPPADRPGVWLEPPADLRSAPVPASSPLGFTLMELLIVLGILGALAMVLLPGFTTNRQELLDDSVVQKELSDIQSAFQRMNADCVLQQADYQDLTRYGVAALMEKGRLPSTASNWNADQGKGWRGPYLEEESTRVVDLGGNPVSTAAQSPKSGGEEVPVVCTPNAKGADDGHYYRIVADADGETVNQLWVVYPGAGGLMTDDLKDPSSETFEAYKYKRRLLLGD